MVDFNKIPRSAEVAAIRAECRREIDSALPEDEPDTIPDWCYDTIIRSTIRNAPRLAPRIFEPYMPEEQTRFYATITTSQYPELAIIHRISGAYVEIRAVNREVAEAKMFAAFGRKWSFFYESLDSIHELDRNRVAILL